MYLIVKLTEDVPGGLIAVVGWDADRGRAIEVAVSHGVRGVYVLELIDPFADPVPGDGSASEWRKGQ